MKLTQALSASFRFSVLFLILGTSAFAQQVDRNPWVAFTPREGNVFLSPVEFFQQMRGEYPEMEVMNPESFPMLKTATEHLMYSGVSYLVGIEPNFESAFELYLPTIARSTAHPETQLSAPLTTRTGHLYLMEHDSAHHLAGIPGLRRSNLADLKKTRADLIRILFLKEIFATAQSSMLYIPKYHEWKMNVAPEKLEDYRAFSQGFYTTSRPLTADEHVSMMESHVFGRTFEYIRALSKNISSASTLKVRELGIPRMVPDFSPILGKKLDSYLAGFVAKYVAPFYLYQNKIGYKGFIKYSNDLADLVLQTWYIEWSDDFKIGFDLEHLEKRTQNLIEQLKSGKDVVDPDGAGTTSIEEWKRNFFKTEVAFFGRRIKEVRALADQIQEIQLKPTFSELEGLDRAYLDTLEIYQKLQARESLSVLKTEFLKLVKHVERSLPIERMIPMSHRLNGMDYGQFWRDPYAYAISRGGLPQTSYAASRLESMKRRGDLKVSKDPQSEIARTKELQVQMIESFSALASNGVAGNKLGMDAFVDHYELVMNQYYLKQLSDFSQLSLVEKEALETKARLMVIDSQALKSRVLDLTRMMKILHRMDALAAEFAAAWPVYQSGKKQVAGISKHTEREDFSCFRMKLVHKEWVFSGSLVELREYRRISEWLNQPRMNECVLILKDRKAQ